METLLALLPGVLAPPAPHQQWQANQRFAITPSTVLRRQSPRLLPRPPDRKRQWVGSEGGALTTTQGRCGVGVCVCRGVVATRWRLLYLGGLSGSEGQSGTRSEERPVHDTEADLVWPRARMGVAPPPTSSSSELLLCAPQQGGAAGQTWLPTSLLHQTTCGALLSRPVHCASSSQGLGPHPPTGKAAQQPRNPLGRQNRAAALNLSLSLLQAAYCNLAFKKNRLQRKLSLMKVSE